MRVSIIELGNGTKIKLSLKDIPDDVLADRILFIDYANIYAEIATMPILLNSIGVLLSECENKCRLADLKLKRWKSKKREEVRVDFIKSKGKFTVDQVDDAVRIDSQYVVLNTIHINYLKQRDDINSLFWSLKSKQSILENLSKSMNISDFREGMKHSISNINHVDIKNIKPLID